MPLIVLEGPDGAGKTRLADELVRLWGDRQSTILHKGPPDPDRETFREYYDDLTEAYTRAHQRRLVVCDRWHLGETVYGPIVRGVSRLSYAELWLLDQQIEQLGGLRVVVTSDWGTIRHHAFTRGETFVTETQLYEVWRAYDRVAREMLWTVADQHAAGTGTLAGRMLRVAGTRAEVTSA